MSPGSIVTCRNRDWVLLPSDQDDLLLLRPLTGATDEVVAVHKRLTELIGYSMPEERVRPASFPRPTVDDLFLQWLSLYALLVNPELDVVLLDEPDAHLHATLQRYLTQSVGAVRGDLTADK